MSRVARSLCVAILVAQLACAGASSYEPRPSPRIAAVHINGRVYVRDGQRYEIGLLGGNGEALVAGNDAATTLARKHQHKAIWGWSLFGLGLATSITGNALVFSRDANDRPPGLVIVPLLGLLPLVASAVLLASARHDLVNAVNIYNDALDGPLAPDAFAPAAPPPGGR